MNELTTAATNAEANDVAMLAPITFDAKAYAAAIFDPFKRQFTKAKREASKVEAYDITTTAGMARAKELRAAFREIRTSVESARKERKAPIIEAGKLLDQRAAEIKAEVEPFEDKYDGEIKAEETRKENEKQRKLAEERARVEAIENRIAQIRGVPGRMAIADSATIVKEIDQWTLLRLDPADYQEHLEDALNAVNTTIDQLNTLLTAAEAREAEARRIVAEREELARLRAEQEARDKIEREAAAERERLAQIERDRIEAERRAAAEREAEHQRQMAFAQAQQAKQQQLMQSVMGIQSRGNFNGSARELLMAIEQAERLEVGADIYGDMASMAQMARDVALAALRSKYQAALSAELDADHVEALEANARLDIAYVEKNKAENDELIAAIFEPLEPKRDADGLIDWDFPIYPPTPAVAPDEIPEPGPTDADLVELVANYYGWTEQDAVRRLANISYEDWA